MGDRSADVAVLPDAAALRAAFDAARPLTVGIEDEVMLLDPESLELAPVGPAVLARLAGDERFKLELPAAQLEITVPAADAVGVLGEGLLAARRAVRERAEGIAAVGACGVHPFSSGEGVLNDLPRYRHTFTQYRRLAARQLVCALQVHVAPGDAVTALAVYNAARGYLPLLAALAANAPFYEGSDTGLASVRPQLCRLLPRQGVPPALESWDELAAAYRWCAAAGTSPGAGSWWWELRPHPRYGTLEFRVPDAQTSVGEAVAVAGLVHALSAWLAERHEAGEHLGSAPRWRIEENRWLACRDGVQGVQADLHTGVPRATVELLHELIEAVRPAGERVGAGAALDAATAMVGAGAAAQAQRQRAQAGGLRELAAWLVTRFCATEIG